MASFVKLPTISPHVSNDDETIAVLVNREQICDIRWIPPHYLTIALTNNEVLKIHQDNWRLLGIAHADELHPEWQPPPKHSPAQFMSRRRDEAKF